MVVWTEIDIKTWICRSKLFLGCCKVCKWWANTDHRQIVHGNWVYTSLRSKLPRQRTRSHCNIFASGVYQHRHPNVFHGWRTCLGVLLCEKQDDLNRALSSGLTNQRVCAVVVQTMCFLTKEIYSHMRGKIDLYTIFWMVSTTAVFFVIFILFKIKRKTYIVVY